MRVRAKIAAAVASVGVLAIGYQVGTAGTGHTTSQTTPTPTIDPTGPAPDTTAPTSPSASPATSTTTQGETTGSFTGETSTHQYGSVTVTVTLTSGVITDVQAETTVNEPRSERYVSMALPTLRSEVLAANSADVNLVSGATYTSQAYIESLQSALDKAGR